jgi:hypothetical protein
MADFRSDGDAGLRRCALDQRAGPLTAGGVRPHPPRMSFARRITRHPIAFDPAAAADALAGLPDVGPEVAALLGGTAGCSPYLKGLMLREAGWLPEALDNPEAAADTVLAILSAEPPDSLAAALRTAKRRMALVAALADLGGLWPLETVTGALTRLADRAVHLAATTLVADEIRRKRLPGATPDDAATAAGMVVLAMGKMGAGELNYSSDIDLICLFDETRYPGEEQEARATFIRVTRRMTAMLSDVTAMSSAPTCACAPMPVSCRSVCRWQRRKAIMKVRAVPGNARLSSRRDPAVAILRRGSGS